MAYTIFFGILFILFLLSIYFYLAYPIHEIKVMWGNIFIPVFLGFIFSSISAKFLILGIQCLVIQIIAPRFVVFMINRSRLVTPFLRTYQTKTKIALFPILGAILIAVIFLMPNQRDAITGQFIFDSSYFVNKVSILISIFLAVIIEKERGVFSANGFFVRGLLFKWSDFSTFLWDNTSGDFAKLIFKLRDNRQIASKIALSDRQVVENLLSKIIGTGTT